jgi:hypothetical protein
VLEAGAFERTRTASVERTAGGLAKSQVGCALESVRLGGPTRPENWRKDPSFLRSAVRLPGRKGSYFELPDLYWLRRPNETE